MADEFDVQEYIARYNKFVSEVLSAPRAQAHPLFYKEIARVARGLTQAQLKRGRSRSAPLSLDERFHPYCLLDPTRPAVAYRIADMKLELPHEPLYIGKGERRRAYGHIKEARRNPTPVQNDHKGNRIRKLLRSGKEPIVLQLAKDGIEAFAFALELILIRAIGRRDLKTGPLTNRTNGGEGGSGVVFSPERRAAVASRSTGRVKSQAEIDKTRAANLGRKLGPQSEEHKKKRAEALRGIPKTKEHAANISRGKTGKKFTTAHCLALGESRRGKSLSESHRRNIGLGNLGGKRSLESRRKMSNSQKGLKKPRIKCPHCLMLGAPSPLYQYHFDNCKHKKD